MNESFFGTYDIAVNQRSRSFALPRAIKSVILGRYPLHTPTRDINTPPLQIITPCQLGKKVRGQLAQSLQQSSPVMLALPDLKTSLLVGTQKNIYAEALAPHISTTNSKTSLTIPAKLLAEETIEKIRIVGYGAFFSVSRADKD